MLSSISLIQGIRLTILVFFQYECVSSKGIYVHIGKEKYLCEYSGQNLSISTMEYNTIYVEKIICPDCQVICGTRVCFRDFFLHFFEISFLSRMIFNVLQESIRMMNREMLISLLINFVNDSINLLKFQCQIRAIN